MHDHHKRTDSLYDPEDDLDVHKKEKVNIRRFCFIGAIAGYAIQ